jgi:hypothetical protein
MSLSTYFLIGGAIYCAMMIFIEVALRINPESKFREQYNFILISFFFKYVFLWPLIIVDVLIAFILFCKGKKSNE